jgi:hypothetical protein
MSGLLLSMMFVDFLVTVLMTRVMLVEQCGYLMPCSTFICYDVIEGINNVIVETSPGLYISIELGRMK